ncbi:MAG TPA: ABC transporter ATP-binding protein [Myxococcota bacterium]|nr:ABC transporter ATP-binding protein [Myxococcota bacterium]
MLRAADVTFAYRRSRAGAVHVLHGVSFDVPAGGFAGILGPNGSGKTTLLRLLSGTERPARGRVTLAGGDLSAIPRAELARHMAVVPQETRLAFDYSVLEVVTMGRYPHLRAFAVEGPEDLAIAREALACTGTAHLEQRAFTTLSGCEKQRVVIAAALAQITASRHAVLLLDEPTAALDLGYQLEIARLLRELQARLDLTIVVSTHDLNFAASLCRSLLLLRDGRVLAEGLTRDALTPGNIRALYDVEAEVQQHDAAGHLVVVPVARTARS